MGGSGAPRLPSSPQLTLLKLNSCRGGVLCAMCCARLVMGARLMMGAAGENGNGHRQACTRFQASTPLTLLKLKSCRGRAAIGLVNLGLHLLRVVCRPWCRRRGHNTKFIPVSPAPSLPFFVVKLGLSAADARFHRREYVLAMLVVCLLATGVVAATGVAKATGFAKHDRCC